MAATSSTTTIDKDLYDAGSRGDLSVCKTLVERGGNINVALIGAHNNKMVEVCEWALDYGACFIFTCNHSAPVSVPRGLKYNKPISMLKGPGDIKKGSFKKE